MALILDEHADAEVMQHTANVFNELQIPYEMRRLREENEDPELVAYLADAADRGLRVIAVGSYDSYMAERFPTLRTTLLPVVMVTTGSPLSSLDQLPPSIAYMGFGAEAARNAGLFAARVLALSDPALAARLPPP